jgi:hypothetical protein
VRPAIEPTGIGARMAIPSKRPAYCGSARVVASAAPVCAGTRLAPAARRRREEDEARSFQGSSSGSLGFRQIVDRAADAAQAVDRYSRAHVPVG